MKKLIVLLFPLCLFSQNNYVFGPSVMVNDDGAGIHYHSTTQRSIGCRGDTVYLVWRDDRYGNELWWNSRIFFSKSIDAGETWSPNLMVSQDLDTLWGFTPYLTLDVFGNIYVGYTTQNQNDNDDDIYFVKSTDGGDSFSAPIMVNDSADIHHQAGGALAVDSVGDNLYVVWDDRRNPEYRDDIYCARSTDGGQSFLPSVRVSDSNDSAYQWYPVVACDETGQYVYVTWQDERDTLHDWDVYFARSTNYGQTFEPNYLISDTATTGGTTQGYPSIYYKDGIIYAVWRDQCDGYCLKFAKSTDNGVSFGPQVLVPDDPDSYGFVPSITVDDSGRIFIVWEDNREYSTYGDDIYFGYSSDSGNSFSENLLVNDHLGSTSAWDRNPSISVNSEGKVFIAWQSDRNDASHTNPDIYFVRGSYVGIEEYSDTDLLPISLACFPNPFRSKLCIKFRISSADPPYYLADQTNIKIYNAVGRLVKQFNELLNNQLTWDSRDEQERPVPAGIYFVELVNGEHKYVRKIIKIE